MKKKEEEDGKLLFISLQRGRKRERGGVGKERRRNLF